MAAASSTMVKDLNNNDFTVRLNLPRSSTAPSQTRSSPAPADNEPEEIQVDYFDVFNAIFRMIMAFVLIILVIYWIKLLIYSIFNPWELVFTIKITRRNDTSSA
jgi:hypothetical protein